MQTYWLRESRFENGDACMIIEATDYGNYTGQANFIHNTFFNDKPIKNDRVLVESDIETIFNGRMNTFRLSYNENYDNKKTDEYIMHEIFEGMRNETLDSVAIM